jgi:ATP-binding cassette, subfamily B, bacterial
MDVGRSPVTRTLWRSFHKVAPYFAPHRRQLLSIGMLAVLSASLAALEPLILKRLFDGFAAPAQRSTLLGPLLLLVALLGAGELIGARLDWLVWRVRLAVNSRLLQATVEKLHALPLSYHRDQGVGATMTRIERGISGCMSAFSDVLVQLLPGVFYLGVSIAVMLQLDLRLSLVVLAFAPLPALLGARASTEQMQRERSLMQRWTQVFSRFNEVLSGIVVIKSFVREEREKRRFLAGVDDANALVLTGVGTDARTRAAKNGIVMAARIAVLGMGGMLIARQQVTLGTLVAFSGYLGGVFNPVQALTGMYQTLCRATVALESVLSILEAQDALGDAPDARDVPTLRGEVEFRDVSFEYRPGVKVVRHIELCARPGEMVALVGPSGAGKTTLMALLQRLYDPSSGSIHVDGLDLRQLKQRQLRAQIGIVLQEGMLFSDTIAENIAFGKPNASRAAIEAAAHAANAHDFIAELPQSYDTLAGERGCRLSGGERQRIAIARALLKDAPILILDEATSALDAEAEERVQQAIARLTRGRTTFVIAHRLSTITAADKIAVLKDGEIAEIGSHAELLDGSAYYASLIRKQAHGLRVNAA